MSDEAKVAAVIPAYNEATTIRDIVARTGRQVPHVIVVDDGSSDATASESSSAGAEVIQNVRNLGKSASLWRGIDAALAHSVSAVVTLDGDGQHRPEDIARLIQAARDYPQHIIIGARLHERAAMPAARYYANRFANFWIAWAAGYPILDSQSGLRLYPSTLLRALPPNLRTAGSFVFESEVLIEAAYIGVRSVFIPVAAIYRTDSRPSHFRGRDIARITRMVAAHLIRRGLHLRGLISSLRGRPIRIERAKPDQPD